VTVRETVHPPSAVQPRLEHAYQTLPRITSAEPPSKHSPLQKSSKGACWPDVPLKLWIAVAYAETFCRHASNILLFSIPGWSMMLGSQEATNMWLLIRGTYDNGTETQRSRGQAVMPLKHEQWRRRLNVSMHAESRGGETLRGACGGVIRFTKHIPRWDGEKLNRAVVKCPFPPGSCSLLFRIKNVEPDLNHPSTHRNLDVREACSSHLPQFTVSPWLPLVQLLSCQLQSAPKKKALHVIHAEDGEERPPPTQDGERRPSSRAMMASRSSLG